MNKADTDDRSRVYLRMMAGALSGAIGAFITGYGFAHFTNNLNVVAGFGLAVLSTIDIVVGAMCGLVRKNRKSTCKGAPAIHPDEDNNGRINHGTINGRR